MRLGLAVALCTQKAYRKVGLDSVRTVLQWKQVWRIRGPLETALAWESIWLIEEQNGSFTSC